MKPNKIVVFGEYIFDYIVISLLLNFALLILLPFLPIYNGIIAYVLHEEKSIKQIFMYIKDNIRLLLSINLLLLIIIGLFYINVHALQTQNTLFYYIVQLLSYILLFVGIIVLIYSPCIIYYMNVTTKQVVYNSLLLFLYYPIQSLIIVVIIFSFIYLGRYSIYIIIFGQYPLIYGFTKFIQLKILKLKERKR